MEAIESPRIGGLRAAFPGSSTPRFECLESRKTDIVVFKSNHYRQSLAMVRCNCRMIF